MKVIQLPKKMTDEEYFLFEEKSKCQKIETLQYYVCIAPEQQVHFFYYKQEDGEWVAETLTKTEQLVSLAKLNISFSVKDIYNS